MSRFLANRPCGESQRCSLVSQMNHEDLIGTATGRWDRYVIVETPLPWKRNVVESASFPPELAQMVKAAESPTHGVRVQGVVPDPEYSPSGYRRIIHLTRPSGPFVRFIREEYVVPHDEAVSLLQALLESERPPSRFDEYRQEETSTRDLLVCTHGSRDACCGNLGVPIYTLLRHEWASAYSGNLRVWRTSHLGGHRFAPTLLDLPEMRYWGRVTPELLEPLVNGSESTERLWAHYRGWAGLRTPFEQVAEREILMRFGAELARLPCTGLAEGLDEDEAGARVRIAYTLPDGVTERAFEAEVIQQGRVVGFGSCRDEEASEFEQYTLVDLVEVTEALRA